MPAQEFLDSEILRGCRIMKTGAVLTTSILALSLGLTGLANAEHGGKGEGDSHWQEGKAHHAEERGRQPSPEHGRPANAPEHRHDYVREPEHVVQRGPGHEHYAERPAQMREVRRSEGAVRQDIWQRQRARDWRFEHRTWQQRGGYHGYRIPEERFRVYFGRRHWFRVHEVPVVVVEGAPRFQFGGYWFTVVDPCPETWSPVWYRTDDVYIDYVNDGYYMYNRQHPGIAIAINVSL